MWRVPDIITFMGGTGYKEIPNTPFYGARFIGVEGSTFIIQLRNQPVDTVHITSDECMTMLPYMVIDNGEILSPLQFAYNTACDHDLLVVPAECPLPRQSAYDVDIAPGMLCYTENGDFVVTDIYHTVKFDTTKMFDASNPTNNIIHDPEVMLACSPVVSWYDQIACASNDDDEVALLIRSEILHMSDMTLSYDAPYMSEIKSRYFGRVLDKPFSILDMERNRSELAQEYRIDAVPLTEISPRYHVRVRTYSTVYQKVGNGLFQPVGEARLDETNCKSPYFSFSESVMGKDYKDLYVLAAATKSQYGGYWDSYTI